MILAVRRTAGGQGRPGSCTSGSPARRHSSSNDSSRAAPAAHSAGSLSDSIPNTNSGDPMVTAAGAARM